MSLVTQLLLVVLLLSCEGETSQSDSLLAEWKEWQATYQVGEVSDERYHIWLQNRELVRAHNEGNHGYKLRLNHFAHMTNEEFVELYGCIQDHAPTNASMLNQQHGTKVFTDYEAVGDTPDSIDWRTAGIVMKVKDQLRCGSSYAFAAMGSLEGLTGLAYGSVEKLSEQNIVDCSVTYGNHGCACGEVNKAFLYVIENQGVDTWKGYPSGGDPYRSKQYECAYDPSKCGAKARGIITLPSGNEDILKSAVGNVGPVSVYVDASSTSFQFYSDGVLNIPHCSTTRLTHGLTLVGYGTLNGDDYWLVKNSWGPNWGNRGFGMMARNSRNNCGIATSASMPTL